MVKSTAVIRERPRQIVHRTHGRRQGPITRLMSPSDLGQTLKPFVFLDLFDTEGGSFLGVGCPLLRWPIALTCLRYRR